MKNERSRLLKEENQKVILRPEKHFKKKKIKKKIITSNLP